MNQDTVRIIPLGGLGEIGKNMTAIEYGGKIVVVDCGMAVPPRRDARHRPRAARRQLPQGAPDDVLAFLITHGHEDHFGALPFILAQLNGPVYGSRLTLAFAKSKLDEHGLLKTIEINEVNDDSPSSSGRSTISFVAVSHSVPDALSIVVDTPLGTDRRSPVTTSSTTRRSTAASPTSTSFARLGERGVLALLGDSTNAESPVRPPRRARSARRSTRSSPRPRDGSSSPASRRTSTASSRPSRSPTCTGASSPSPAAR